MIIRDIFSDDINRQINGVIQVDQAGDDVIEQELNEYVITKELKKHFITFFNYYSDSMGVRSHRKIELKEIDLLSQTKSKR